MRRTQREQDKERRDYLRERMGHVFVDGTCRYCKRADAKSAVCAGRRKPNRWRLHLQRFRVRTHCPMDYTWNASECLRLYRELERACAALPQDDLRIWAYHPTVRRARRVLKTWWAFPASAAQKALAGDKAAGREHNSYCGPSVDRAMSAGRTALLKRAAKLQARVLHEHGCTYTFHETATLKGQPLFHAFEDVA